MHLRQVEQMLPNGFHDAYLGRFEQDFVRREVKLYLDLLMGNDDEPAQQRYQRAKLTLSQCALVALEPAVCYREIKPARGLWLGETQLKENEYTAIRDAGFKIPDENFWLALFVYDWNSRVVINAADASLEFL